jgi:hypothetical protein
MENSIYVSMAGRKKKLQKTVQAKAVSVSMAEGLRCKECKRQNEAVFVLPTRTNTGVRLSFQTLPMQQ